MYGIALGTGASLSAYKRSNHPDGAIVIGANDIYSRCKDIDAVACADTGKRIRKTRPEFAQTPLSMPVYNVLNRQSPFKKAFPQHTVIEVPSSRFNRKHMNRLKLDLMEDVEHGTCTPIWIVSLLLAMGHSRIYVYGVDLRGHECMDTELRRVGIGEELHRLHVEAQFYGGFVKLTKESPLHNDLADIGVKFKLEMF